MTNTEGEDSFLPKYGKKLIKNVDLKGLKFTNLRYQLLEHLNKYLHDTHVQFNWFLTKIVKVDRFLSPNFAKFQLIWAYKG